MASIVVCELSEKTMEPKCSQASQTEVVPTNEVDILGKRKRERERAEERFDTRSEEWIKKRIEELESVWEKNELENDGAESSNPLNSLIQAIIKEDKKNWIEVNLKRMYLQEIHTVITFLYKRRKRSIEDFVERHSF